MQSLRLVYQFLRYRLKSFRLHGIHSPFVFDLYQHVITHDGQYQAYTCIEKQRRKLKSDSKLMEITDFGAGSKSGQTKTRTVSQLAKISSKPPKYAQLLFRLVNFYRPQTILELGTSLGLTTAYLAKARTQGKIVTLEGCPAIANEAQENFKDLELKNIEIITGDITHTLPALVNKTDKLDFVFFDGNHRYEPTLFYFKTCLAKSHENSVFVFDDIYWSPEMEKAWREICKHPAVTVSIDLFQIGIIFFRKNQAKEHFTLWY